jgi:L-ascorbate metabolism protein UlaG (beta-lactamase superfamily)
MTNNKYKILLLAVIFILPIGCMAINKHINRDYDPKKSHHTENGFRNKYSNLDKKEGFLKWQWHRFINNLPKPPKNKIEGIKPDLELINNESINNKVTWIGHVTMLIQTNGLNILTDPHFGERASPISFMGPKRHQKPGLEITELPRIDLALISHNHYDHLDINTIKKLLELNPEIKFLVPLGVQYWFEGNIKGSILNGDNKNVIAMDWDDSHKIIKNGCETNFHFLSVQHWSARTMWDRNQTLWGSFAIINPEFRFWFSGDLGYSKDTKDIGDKFGGFDVAAIGIGAYEPRWFMSHSHLNPKEAVQVMKDIKAKTSIGIHWGTFENMTDEPLDQPPEDLEKALSEENEKLDFRIMKHGQTISFKNK